MNCPEYRAKYSEYRPPLPQEVWDTPEFDAWIEHGLYCERCSGWRLEQQLIERGIDPDSFPCVCIGEQVTRTCDQHPDPHDCPDALVIYYARFDEYSIPIRDGTRSVVRIQFCPWCGVRLPESKCDRWWDELEAMGFDEPYEQDIPDEYKSDEWYREDG
jgi:hypothetical protein